MTLTVDDAVADSTPPVKMVYLLLVAHDDWATMADVSEWGALPERTVRDALARLHEAGVLDKRQCLDDGRRQCYRLTV